MTTHDRPSQSHLDRMLGRYECVQDGHNKFWECLHVSGQGSSAVFCVRWGKIGAKKPQNQHVDFYTAQKRMDEKRRTYTFIPGSPKTWSEVQHATLTAIVAQSPGATTSAPAPRRM